MKTESGSTTLVKPGFILPKHTQARFSDLLEANRRIIFKVAFQKAVLRPIEFDAISLLCGEPRADGQTGENVVGEQPQFIRAGWKIRRHRERTRTARSRGARRLSTTPPFVISNWKASFAQVVPFNSFEKLNGCA
jgi:hypothetical protein